MGMGVGLATMAEGCSRSSSSTRNEHEGFAWVSEQGALEPGGQVRRQGADMGERRAEDHHLGRVQSSCCARERDRIEDDGADGANGYNEHM